MVKVAAAIFPGGERIPGKHLWKFRSFDTNLLSVLLNKEVWFAKPHTFNDPFDCKTNLATLMQRYEPFVPGSIKDGLSEVQTELEDYFESNPCAYFCLCPVYDQTLMWSHYANNHKGLSLGFSDNENTFDNDEISVRQVCYSPQDFEKYLHDYLAELDAYKAAKDTASSDKEWFSSKRSQRELFDFYRNMKAECWRYEEEVRLSLETPNQNGIAVGFHPKSLKHIIFGMRCSERDKAMITQLVSQIDDYDHIKLWQAQGNHIDMTIKLRSISSVKTI